MSTLSPRIGYDPDSAGRDEPPIQGFLCPDRDCCERLETHQPQPENPNKLLGICPACDAWYLIALDLRTGRYELRSRVCGDAAAA